jgi:hypothetical protein
MSNIRRLNSGPPLRNDAKPARPRAFYDGMGLARRRGVPHCRLLSIALAVLALARALPARAEAPASDAACFPACRSGYLCHEARCISACNPPCGAAETCTAAAECVPTVPPAPPVLVGEAVPRGTTPAPVVDRGWARGAFYFGATAVAVDIAFTVAVVATNPEQASLSRTLGAWSIAVFGVTAPVTAMGGGSARTHPAVTGHPGLRIASWIGYALTLGEAALLLSQSHNAVIRDASVLSVGVLGTLSTLGFAIDARISAAQAERLQATGSARATIGFASASAGGLVPTLGLAGRF